MFHRSLRCSSRNPVHLFNGLARPPLFPRPSFSEICPFLVMPWRGILCPRATTFPFLSFSRKTTKKKVNFSTPLPLVWNECSTSILHVLFSSCKPEFSGISLCSPSSSSPSASLGHHLTHLQLSLMVSAQRYLQFRPWTIFTSLRFKTRSQSQQTRLRLSELEEGPRPLIKHGVHKINPPCLSQLFV